MPSARIEMPATRSMIEPEWMDAPVAPRTVEESRRNAEEFWAWWAAGAADDPGWRTVAEGEYTDCAALVAALRARGIVARVVVDQKGEES